MFMLCWNLNRTCFQSNRKLGNIFSSPYCHKNVTITLWNEVTARADEWERSQKVKFISMTHGSFLTCIFTGCAWVWHSFYFIGEKRNIWPKPRPLQSGSSGRWRLIEQFCCCEVESWDILSAGERVWTWWHGAVQISEQTAPQTLTNCPGEMEILRFGRNSSCLSKTHNCWRCWV